MQSLLVPLAIFGLCAAGLAQSVLTVCRDDGQLRTVDPMTGATLSSVTITEPGGRAISGANGLCSDNGGTLRAVLSVAGLGWVLATLDPTTGAAVVVGPLPERFASIASPGTVLFGVTGDGAPVPESLFMINPVNAATSLVMALGNGSNGEAIVANPRTGELFHASGTGVRNVDRIFESVDVGARSTTPIPIFGHDSQQILAMAHWTGHTFLATDAGRDLMLMEAGGAVTHLATLDHTAKGMVFSFRPTQPSYFLAYGNGCADPAGFTPLFAGVNDPAPGNTVQLWVRNAPGGAVAVIAVGIASASIPLSGTCELQIDPQLGIVFPIAISGTGSGGGTGSVPLSIPIGIGPLDAYLQSAQLAGGGLVLSNPLSIHVQ